MREAAEVTVQVGLVDVLAGIGVPVYTVVPQAADGGSAAVFPYIQIDDPVFAPFDTASNDGHDFVVRIHVRWRGGSKLPGKRLQGEIYERLHHMDLPLTGWRVVLLKHAQSFVDTLTDQTFDGVCEFNGLIEKT